jgi:hypothetical protein
MSLRVTVNAHRSASRAGYTAEIIESNGPIILSIIDLNEPGSRTVTDAINDVLRELQANFGAALPAIIIYRSTLGIWNGVKHTEGTFLSYYSLDVRNLPAAIELAKSRYTPNPTAIP